MFRQRLMREGDEYLVVIPAEEVERLGLGDGDIVSVTLSPYDDPYQLSTELREAMRQSWSESLRGTQRSDDDSSP
jgi:bifunctional DNA-binding transcriptional regulator/antitoxin component of YhaV-PrlF toxin-antitoxin module